MAIQAVKGTHDLYGDEAYAYQYIEEVFSAVAELYGFKPMEVPVIEHTEVFSRSTGEGSDVVRKEMYTFLDKGERSLTLRPEFTAGVMRSIVENKLYATPDLPLKLYYCGPVFRYERPQLGRYREFRQAGIEAVGEDSAYLDAEVMALAVRVLDMLGFQDVKLLVNTLGTSETRKRYRDALVEYFAPKIDSMCDDCKERLKLNPLRILDCKVEADQEIAKGAPRMSDFLSDEDQKRFYLTLSILNDIGISYEIDPTLVRGLDYYGQVVFEVHAKSKEGKDYGALLGGGHYDGLLAELGGPKECDHGVGFALGVERLYSVCRDNGLLDDLYSGADLYLMPLGEKAQEDTPRLAEQLRALGYSCLAPYATGKLGSYFKKAERAKARYAVIYGEEELEKGEVQLKDLRKKEQLTVRIEELQDKLDSLFGEGEHHHH